MELTVLCVSFTLLLLLGVPVAFAIGLSSVATILAAGLPIAVVFQKMVGGMQVFSFLAIPFFVFAGELMLYGGIAERIVRFANSMVGHVRGGLGMSNVLGCTLFGGIVGSPVADVSAMGSVMIPLMKKEGYDADYAVNVTTHAALVGALMPTSHNLILFTLATSGLASVSVLGLILAGVVPALILTLCNLGAAYWVAKKRGYPTHGSFPGWAAVATAFAAIAPARLEADVRAAVSDFQRAKGIEAWVVEMAGTALNLAFNNAAGEPVAGGKVFSPANWIKGKASLTGISGVVQTQLAMLPRLGAKDQCAALALPAESFEYRWQAD